MLSQSIAKRKEWSKEFNLAEKTIYDLFSEFSCMKMIAKAEKNSALDDKEPDNDGGMKAALPISDKAKSSQFMKLKINKSNFKLNKEDLSDFRVPLRVL